MEKLRQFLSAIIAGILIGMGGTVYLAQENSVVGSFLFAVGLFTIVIFQLHLFTGKIGYLPFQKPNYLIELAITWLGNLVGTFVCATMVRNSRIGDGLMDKVEGIVEVKLSDSFLSLFLLAIFCGFLMFIAVDTFKKQSGSTVKVIAIFVPVMVFILSGFEHVIADMYYFSLAQSWSGHCLMAVVVMTLGNSVGGMLIPIYQKFFCKDN